MLLENAPGVIDGIAACRAIRLLPIEGAQEMPVIILQNGGTDTEDEEAGVTERLEAPLSPVYLQFRVQAWMLRQACRWQRAEPPAEEELRLAAVRSLAILDTPPEERFDRLTRLAAAVFDVPVALVTLVDMTASGSSPATVSTCRRPIGTCHSAPMPSMPTISWWCLTQGWTPGSPIAPS